MAALSVVTYRSDYDVQGSLACVERFNPFRTVKISITSERHMRVQLTIEVGPGHQSGT